MRHVGLVFDAVESLRGALFERDGNARKGLLGFPHHHVIGFELNNALTPILNYAKLGLRNPDPEFHRRAFEKILEAGTRASAIRVERRRRRASDMASSGWPVR